MTNLEINSKIDEIKRIQAAVDALEKTIEDFKSELKAELDERKVDSIKTDLHNVFYNVYEKKSVDNDKLRAAGLYDLYTKKSTVIQFKITDCKG